MALQEIEPTSAPRMEAVARVALRGANTARRARLKCASMMLAMRPDDPGPSSRKAGGPKDPRYRRTLDRRPAPPSLRLPLASMGRGPFLRLVTVWLAAVIAVLVLALAVRWFG